MFSKKGVLPVIEVIVILIISSLTLTYFMFQLFNLNQFDSDQGKIKEQIFNDYFFNSKCFLNKHKDTIINAYALFEKDQITFDRIKECTKKFTKIDQKFLFLNETGDVIGNYEITQNGKPFVENRRFCRFSKTNYCSSQTFLIRYIDQNGKYSIGEVKISLIIEK
jgi:hypothetical protein